MLNGKNIHFLGLSGKRLPATGMTVSEALNRGKRWWKTVGSEEMRRARDREGDGLREDKQLHHDSGILFGKPWDELSANSQMKIVGYWYCEFIRQEIGIEQKFDEWGDPIPFKPPREELEYIQELIIKEGK